MIRHAGLIARRVGGDWLGALIEGPSGAGKSDLALRAGAAGWRLVADDRVRLFNSEGLLFGLAPAPIAGLIEARGVGMLAAPVLAFARVALLARCVAEASDAERMPNPATVPLMGATLPLIEICPFETAALDKLAAALEQLGARSQQGYQARFGPLGGR
jgi:serine kinase of HPr protein (carbohydrate metabolism regulator)